MLLTLQIATVLLVAVTMSLALAHALELPGKMRLGKEAYLAVQTIYYPGFTYGGFAEGVGMLATLVLLFMTPTDRPAFWSTVTAFFALGAMQAVYWVVTHPVNKFWMKDIQLMGVAGRFLSLDPMKEGAATEEGSEGWRSLRDGWEYSHVFRAILAVIALVALIVAVAI
jgi:hypothetical protein